MVTLGYIYLLNFLFDLVYTLQFHDHVNIIYISFHMLKDFSQNGDIDNFNDPLMF